MVLLLFSPESSAGRREPHQSAAGRRLNAPGPAVAVLLTTYNEPQRSEMYAKRLEWWLTQTTLPIYVVDSFNRRFPQEGQAQFRQFQVHHFDQTPTLGSPPRGGSTPAELLSLKEAFKAFRKDWAQFDYVVKITGKYAIPDLAASMAKTDPGNDFILQSSSFNLHGQYPGWVGTECVAFNAKKMGDLVALIEKQEPLPVESKLSKLLLDSRRPFQQLPSMPLLDAYKTPRGDGLVLGSVLQARDGKHVL